MERYRLGYIAVPAKQGQLSWMPFPVESYSKQTVLHHTWTVRGLSVGHVQREKQVVSQTSHNLQGAPP